MRDDFDEKPCISFSAKEVQSATKPAKTRVKEEEKGTRPFGPALTPATEGWETHPWPFTPHAEQAISFGGPVAEEKSNLCFTFGMVNDEELVEKALTPSSSATIKSEDSVNSNLVTLMVDSGASGHYFNDAITRDLKQRLQDSVYLTTPHIIFTTGEALLNGTAEGVLQGLVTDDNGNQILFRIDIVVVLGIGRNLSSLMTAAKKGIVAILDYENSRLKGFNATVPLRSESGDLYLFVLNLSADRYGAKKLAMNAVVNAQVWHRWLGHLYAQSLNNLRKRDGTGTTFEELSRTATFAVGKGQQFAHPKTANHKVSRPFQLCATGT